MSIWQGRPIRIALCSESCAARRARDTGPGYVYLVTWIHDIVEPDQKFEKMEKLQYFVRAVVIIDNEAFAPA